MTGRRSAAVQKRAEELGIEILRQGIDDKLAAVGEILERRGVSWQQTAFIGDDLPDLPVLDISSPHQRNSPLHLSREPASPQFLRKVW